MTRSSRKFWSRSLRPPEPDGRDAASPRIPWIPRRQRLPPNGFCGSIGTWLFLLAFVLIGLTAVDTDANLLLILFGLCGGALVASFVAGWLGLRNLVVKRVVQDGVMAGQPFVIRYQLTNPQRWWSSYSLHLVDVIDTSQSIPLPEAFVPMLRPGESITVEVPMVFRRRGRVVFDQIAVATRYPFGLFTKYATASLPQTVLVYPALGRIRDARWSSRNWAEAISIEGQSRWQRGDDEFYGLREYRLGDNPRRIHWRRSARTRTLVVREMAAARANQIWCVLDSRIPSDDPYLADRLELAIRCAATVACDAIESSGRVGFICNGEPLLILPPAGGRDYRLRILRELAMRAPNHTDRLADRLARVAWPSRWRGRCLIFAGRFNDDLGECAKWLSGRVGSTSIYIPGTPAFDAIFSVATHETRAPRRSRLQSSLRPATRTEFVA